MNLNNYMLETMAMINKGIENIAKKRIDKEIFERERMIENDIDDILMEENGAYCEKCRDSVLGEKDGLCGKCI